MCMPEKTYPECEKLKKVHEKSQTIGEFLEWLEGEKGVVLMVEKEDETYPISFQYHTEGLLAEYFEIDLKKVEAERREMLADLIKNGG